MLKTLVGNSGIKKQCKTYIILIGHPQDKSISEGLQKNC